MPASYTESFRSDFIYFNNYLTRPIADHPPKHEDGFLKTSDQSGAGIKPKMEVLGEAEFVIKQAWFHRRAEVRGAHCT